jgi:hypothetical protein
MTTLVRVVSVAAIFASALATACSDSPISSRADDGGAPLPIDAGTNDARVDEGDAARAVTSIDAGIAPANDGGADASGADASMDAATDAAPSPTDAAPSPPDAGPPTCPTNAMWGAGTALAISGTLDDLSPAVTPDELTMAWLVDDGSAVTIHYADRASAGQPFSSDHTVANASVARDRIALSADGLRLAAVDVLRKTFFELSRPNRQAAFDVGPPGDGAFAQLDAYGRMWLQTNEFYASPVFASDDLTLYYSRYGAVNVTDTLWVSTRSAGATWPLGHKLAEPAFASVQDKRRDPTGISADGRTLFYWDATTGTERAAWRPGIGFAFDTFADIGTRSGAQPNTACDALYYAATGANGVDLFSCSRL